MSRNAVKDSNRNSKKFNLKWNNFCQEISHRKLTGNEITPRLIQNYSMWTQMLVLTNRLSIKDLKVLMFLQMILSLYTNSRNKTANFLTNI